jgi:D-alanyl-D-alanine dipeptidase
MLAVSAVSLSLAVPSHAAEAEAEAAACPAALTAATRLVLVTTERMDSVKASLQLYARETPDASWQPQGGNIAAVAGKSGLGWAFDQAERANGQPVKREGDGRTPAGVFRAGTAFGTKPRPGMSTYLKLTSATVCVDDVASPHYNAIVPRKSIAAGISHERMGAIPLYRQGLFIAHPTSREQRGGSCIFLHVWRRPGSPTVGCVAAAETTVVQVQDFLDGQAGAIAILPADARRGYAHCGLPQP